MKRWQRLILALAVVVLLGTLVVVAIRGKNDKKKEVIPVNKAEVIPTKGVYPAIKFGVMADIHLDWEEWSKYLAIAKNRGDEFVIIAGDMTSLGKENELIEAKKTLDRAGIKYYVVPGNHDLWMSAKLKEPLFNEIFGKDYQSFKWGEVKFILVNNGDAAGLGGVQTTWLQNEIKECRVIFCVAVMHMPLNNSFSGHVMGEGSTAVTNEAAKVIKMFNDYGVKETITGHLHYSTSYELDGITTTIVGAISRDRNNQTPRYTEFTVANQILNWDVVEE